MSIWNAEGLLPPIDESNPVSLDRSPYEISLVNLIHLFSISMDRCKIMQGFLRHRAELHKLGLKEGFQWLDGSFTENIELIEARSPNDVDVVTFTELSDSFVEGLSEQESQLIFDQDWIKQNYNVDFYPQSMTDTPRVLVQMTAYWYSMWSHRRSSQWKGFLSVNLADTYDTAALSALNARIQELGHEQN